MSHTNPINNKALKTLPKRTQNPNHDCPVLLAFEFILQGLLSWGEYG